MIPNPKMFCFQCEQTKEQKGCTTIGVCGKTPTVANMQDLLIAAMKNISVYARRSGSRKYDAWILDATFSTLTNVNFDESRFVTYLREAQQHITSARREYEAFCKSKGTKPEPLGDDIPLPTTGTVQQLNDLGTQYGVLTRKAELGDDYVGLQELIMYGLKGLCAYADHARVAGKPSDEIASFIVDTFDFLSRKDATVPELLGWALRLGEQNYKVMELLNIAHKEKLGTPTPTKVRTTAVKGKCIVVSGHDLTDILALLKQTEGKGINVYTHGEMLPAHAYPELKKYPHLVGNYGGAWQNQKMEFSTFPGSILMTSNCIIEPMKGYKDRIFTTHSVGWPGVKHLETKDFTPVIEAALKAKGFDKDEPAKYTTTGFGHDAVLGVADKVVDAVKQGEIKHFFLIGGCDGAEGERNYFKELALASPKDTMILTLACGKYRFNKFDHGTVAGLPRMLDIGQCNDAYSAVQIAVALAKAFSTDVNHLPLSFAVSWFEQKAVAVLLTLLHLGIKNIYLGPHLPAFCTPTMMKVLVETFGLRQIKDVKTDMRDMMAPRA